MKMDSWRRKEERSETSSGSDENSRLNTLLALRPRKGHKAPVSNLPKRTGSSGGSDHNRV